MACTPTTTYNDFTGGGSTTQFTFTFEYINATDVKVRTGAEPPYADVPVSDYSIDPANPQTITFVTAPTGPFRVYRCTSDSDLDATFQAGSAVRAGDLNDNFKQLLYLNQESRSTENSNFGVTQNQLDQLDTDLTAEITSVETDLTADINSVEADLTALETQVNTNSTNVQNELDTKIDTVNASSPLSAVKTGTNLALSIPNATSSADGAMSQQDKAKLDGLNFGPSSVPIPNLQLVTTSGSTTTDSITASGFSTTGTVAAQAGTFVGKVTSDSTVSSDSANTLATKSYVDAQSGGSGISNVVDDTTPQLGGDLDVNGNNITSASNGNVVIDPNGTGDIVLDADVGIGTTSPSANLHISDADPEIKIQDSDGTNQFARFRQVSGSTYYESRNNAGAGAHVFQTYNGTSYTERMRINTNGNVGIGTSSPASTLDVDGTYVSNVEAVSALDIDCSTGNYFTKTINANSTFTFSNVPSSRAYSFTLELTHTSGTVTWPSSVKFNSDTAPTLTTGKTHLFMFVTDDGGTRFRAAALVDYVN